MTLQCLSTVLSFFSGFKTWKFTFQGNHISFPEIDVTRVYICGNLWKPQKPEDSIKKTVPQIMFWFATRICPAALILRLCSLHLLFVSCFYTVRCICWTPISTGYFYTFWLFFSARCICPLTCTRCFSSLCALCDVTWWAPDVTWCSLVCSLPHHH